jgi:hypothetical protein
MDVDIVHSRDAANVARLLPFLESIDAIFRIQPDRRIRRQLDLLCTIGQDLTYEDLLPHSEEMEIADGLHIRVLNLETLIQIKSELQWRKGPRSPPHPPPHARRKKKAEPLMASYIGAID